MTVLIKGGSVVNADRTFIADVLCSDGKIVEAPDLTMVNEQAIDVAAGDPTTIYVGAGSGNLWKTDNSGTTWKPIFDDQGSYSIGDVTIDPNHPDVIWVGTGENVSGRHVAWGDGVYKSTDGGKTWNLILSAGEYTGANEVLMHPTNPDILYAAMHQRFRFQRFVAMV